MASNKQSISTNNYIAIAVLISLVVLLASFFVGRVLVGQLLLNNRVISKKTEARDQLQSNADAISGLQLNYTALGSKVGLIDDALPAKPDFPAIASMIEVMANSSGVRLKSLSPESEIVAVAPTSTTVPGSPQNYSFTANLEGSYDALLKFFTTVEQSARPLKVTTISQTGSSATQIAVIQFTTYYQGPADLTPKTEVVK